MIPVTARLAVLSALVLAAQLSAAHPRHGWETIVSTTTESSDPVDIGFDRRGNVFLAVTGYWSSPGDGSMSVLSVHGRSGAERWQRLVPPNSGGSAAASDLAIDSRGDVFAVGYTDDRDGGAFHEAAVVKLDGRSGVIEWRPNLGRGIARHIELDRRGDAFVAVGLPDVGEAKIVKLSGSDGSIKWATADLPLVDGPFAVDRRRDVVAGISRGIVKLSGRDGTELWRAGAGYVSQIRAARRGVFYSIELTGSVTQVVARAMASGSELWHVEVPRTLPNGSTQRFHDVATLRDGALLLAVTSVLRGAHLTVHERASGRIRWRRTLPSPDGRSLIDIAVARDDTMALLWGGRAPVVQAVAPGSGQFLWAREFTAPNTSLLDVEFDRWGNVVVAGDDLRFTSDGGRMSGAYVAKLGSASSRARSHQPARCVTPSCTRAALGTISSMSSAATQRMRPVPCPTF